MISSGDRSYLFLPETGSEHLQELMQALAVINVYQ